MMDIKRLRRNARHTLRMADREDWSATDASRILANDALEAANVITVLLAGTEKARDMLSLMYGAGIGNEDEARTIHDLITALDAAITAAKSTA